MVQVLVVGAIVVVALVVWQRARVLPLLAQAKNWVVSKIKGTPKQ